MNNLKNKIISLGGKKWAKNGMERVYISNDILNVLRKEKGLDEVCYGERNNKIFFDTANDAVMRSYKSKKPAVELQFNS